MHRRSLLIALLVVAATLAFAGPGAGSSHYAITADPSVDTAATEREVFNEPVEVEDIARADPDGSVVVAVSAPSGEQTRVIIYNEDKDILYNSNLESGSYDVSFDFGPANLDPGSYAIVLDHEGSIVDAMPLVLSGYRVTVDAPGSVTQGDSITVTAEVTVVDATKPIDRVQVVVGDEDNNRRVTLDGPGGAGTYEKTFTVDQLPAGDYKLYVGVQGEQVFQGRQELLGVSDSHDFAIEASTTSSTTTTATTTTTTTATTTASGGALPGGGGAAPGGGSADGGTTTGEPADGTATDGDPSDPTPTTTDGVVTPNPTPATTDQPTTTSGQALGLLPPALALLLVALLARRRR